jgi:enoyl-[acyl-carrier-protein] reductase (NADH)
MAGLTGGSNWTHLIPGFIVSGLGGGMVNPPLASTAIGVVPPQKAGMASGVNTTFRQIGIAAGIAALGSIFTAAIGSATCKMLAARGAAVVVLDENERRTHATVRALTEEFGTEVYPVVADVADRQAIDDGLARVEAELGPIDILVNSAAINVQGSIFEFRPEDWDRVIQVDLTAPWYLMRKLMPGMRDRGWGAIVNVTSVAAYIGGGGREGPYSAAKAGLHDLTRAAAIEGGAVRHPL